MTHEQMIAEIEAFKKQIPDEFKREFIPILMEYYEKIMSYLIMAHSGTDWLPETAAILTDLVVDVAMNKEGFFPNVVEILAFFDMYHDLLQKSTQNRVGNMLPAAATLCKKLAYIYFINLGDGGDGGGDGGEVQLPVAVDDNFIAAPGTVFNLDAIFSNDLFFDKEKIGTELGSDGNLAQYLSEENFYINIPENYTGTIHEKYRIQTESGWSNWAQITIIVGVPPVAVNDDVTIRHGESWTYGVGDNDTITGQNIQFKIHQQPSHGTLNEYGQYVPDPGYVGVDEFHYYITNEFGTSNIAVVTINVLPAIPFPGTTVDLSSESNQGRITWSFNMQYAPGVLADDLTKVVLSVPSATPSSVVDNSPGNMITPGSSDMRNKIASIGENNLLIFTFSYVQDGAPRQGELHVMLPHFSLELNQSFTNLPVVFVDTLGL